MNKQLLAKDYFTFGILFAFCWHLFWFVFFNPKLENAWFKKEAGESFFLGMILQAQDFQIRPLAPGQGLDERRVPSKDLSRDNYFFKNPVDFDKPMTVISKEISPGYKTVFSFNAKPGRGELELRRIHEVTFGPSDYARYLDNIDFSDCAPYFSRPDLLNFIDFEVFLNEDGLVRSIKKTTSCGDPTVDMVVWRKLKNAVFKDVFLTGAWVHVRFKLK